MDKEEFVWKTDGKIFKGVGIYHLTFNVANDALKLGVVRGRAKEEIAAVVQPLLDAGEACDASNPKYVAAVKGMAWVELTPLGKAVERDLGDFDKHHKGTKVCQKVVMDTHAHIVVWGAEGLWQDDTADGARVQNGHHSGGERDGRVAGERGR